LKHKAVTKQKDMWASAELEAKFWRKMVMIIKGQTTVSHEIYLSNNNILKYDKTKVNMNTCRKKFRNTEEN
jgi:hypothetical protein